MFQNITQTVKILLMISNGEKLRKANSEGGRHVAVKKLVNY